MDGRNCCCSRNSYRLKKLEEAGKTYKNLLAFLSVMADAILKDEEILEKYFRSMEKSFMLPWLYRLGGKMMQKSVIKKIGKDKFFSRPLEI